MIICPFVPILAIYAGWRIQKFWLLLILDFIVSVSVGGSLSPISTVSPELSMVLDIAGTIIINIILVKHFAEKYNQTILAD